MTIFERKRCNTFVTDALGRSILGAARNDKRAEVLYTVIEALTADARDHSLDYKISGLSVGKGSWEAQVVAGLAPGADDIVLPKGSSSVFCSTNLCGNQIFNPTSMCA